MRSKRRLCVIEPVEPRLLLASVSVLNNNDSGTGSLRAAISAAANGDTVDLSNLSGTITLTSEIVLDKNLAFTGPGASDLAVTGNHTARVFYINSGKTVSISDLTIADSGQAGSLGGGIYTEGGNLTLERVNMTGNRGVRKGGAIAGFSGTFNFTDCTFSNNIAGQSDFAIGGSVLIENSTLTMTRCTLSNNSANAVGTSGFMGMGGRAYAGGLYISGTSATITNSTFSGNTAFGDRGAASSDPFVQGGGVNIAVNGNVSVINCTIVGNTASVSHNTMAQGGGLFLVYASGTVNLKNNLIAGNAAPAGPDVYNTISTTNSFNLVGDGTNSNLINGANNNQVGTAQSPINALVSALADNGGLTQTRALLAGSPAIDAGTATGAPSTDQRAIPRAGATDIGAFEFAILNAAPEFTSTAPVTVTADSSYSYTITATDVDLDELTIYSTLLPDWLTLTDNGDGTAILAGTPTNADVGDHVNPVVLKVSDGTDTDTQAFEINVSYLNHAPVIASTLLPATAIAQSAITGFELSASDVDNDNLTFTSTTLPTWMTLTDNGHGGATLTGTPTDSDAGVHPITIRVSDGTTFAERSFNVEVLAERFRLAAGVLYVNGSADNDVMQVWIKDKQIRVVRNGVTKNYPLANVQNVQVLGFDGDDSISVNTRTIPAYVLGGAGNDTLLGADEPDNLVGGGGKDLIDAGGGSDRLDGFSGNDKLVGGIGDDRLFGGDGNDTLFGDTGTDILRGEAGDDYLLARDSTVDSLLGGPDNDYAQVDPSDDQLDLLSLIS